MTATNANTEVIRREEEQMPAAPPVNPMALLQQAIESNVDVAKLEKLLDLQERWERNQAAAAFAQAMQRAQAAMPRIVKDADNDHTGSRYARLETIQDLIKPVYLGEGFSISFSEDVSPRENWIRVKAVVRHANGHSETYFRDGPVDNLGPKGSPVKTLLHGAASTNTYMQRHLLCGIFSITIANFDNDGNAEPSPAPTPAANAPRTAPRAERKQQSAPPSPLTLLKRRWLESRPHIKETDPANLLVMFGDWATGVLGEGTDWSVEANWKPEHVAKCNAAMGGTSRG